MVRKYKLSLDAKQDLKNIYTYGYHRWGEKQADIYFNGFFDAFSKISKQPDHYPEVDHIREGYRRCVCGVDSIYFRQKNNEIEIMSIIGNQDTDGL